MSPPTRMVNRTCHLPQILLLMHHCPFCKQSNAAQLKILQKHMITKKLRGINWHTPGGTMFYSLFMLILITMTIELKTSTYLCRRLFHKSTKTREYIISLSLIIRVLMSTPLLLQMSSTSAGVKFCKLWPPYY